MSRVVNWITDVRFAGNHAADKLMKEWTAQ
jgi:hypothetical protein